MTKERTFLTFASQILSSMYVPVATVIVAVSTTEARLNGKDGTFTGWDEHVTIDTQTEQNSRIGTQKYT